MAKFQMVKLPGGVLSPANDDIAEDLKSLKNDGLYEVEIKKKINPLLHRKTFSFFTFCFNYWCAEHGLKKYSVASAQFEEFREFLTIKAGHCEMVFNIQNPEEFTLRAKSISYAKFDDDIERGKFFSALINAALEIVFPNCKDENIINQLYAFF